MKLMGFGTVRSFEDFTNRIILDSDANERKRKLDMEVDKDSVIKQKQSSKHLQFPL